MRRRAAGPGTTAVHAGETIDSATGAVVAPIYQTSTFAYPLTPDGDGAWRRSAWFYTRYANPTVAAAEAKVAALEGADACRAFASGMGALAAALFSNARAGQRVVSMGGVYGGTQTLLRDHVAPLGIEVASTREMGAGALADLVDERTRLVLTELPTNPFNRVIDLPDVRRRIDKQWGRGAPRILTDATFATPLNLRPLERGADLSMHSATKYLNGHADVIGGMLSGGRRDVERVEAWRKYVGACMDPHQAFLLLRGLKTLEVRLRRSERNAALIAEALEAHPKVRRVWHLSLKGHPDYALARRLLRGPGAVVTFELQRPKLAAARRFMHALRLFAPAPSLGGVESLSSLPVETSHAQATAADRRAQGITNGTVRLAVGIETATDLVDDVRAALRRA